MPLLPSLASVRSPLTRLAASSPLLFSIRSRPAILRMVMSTQPKHSKLKEVQPERKRVPGSSVVINGKPEFFRSAGISFQELLQQDGQVYFDRTRYISKLNKLDKFIFFCRPRRFGKTLAVSMLQHFHSLEYADDHKFLYKGLDVQNDIDKGNIKPGQYFVLKFNFSRIGASKDLAGELNQVLNNSIKRFYRVYASYLGRKRSDLLKEINEDSAHISLENCVGVVELALRAQLDALADVRGIYLLVDEYDALSNCYPDPPGNTEAARHTTPVGKTFKSFWSTVLKEISEHSKEISKVDDEISENTQRSDKHLLEMTTSFNGFHFCRHTPVEIVYNTETCLQYLQDLVEGGDPETEDPENSEITEQFLRAFATSSEVIKDCEEALGYSDDGDFAGLKYGRLRRNLTLHDLKSNLSVASWRSLMIYFGGFTFHPKNPAKYLKIPNLVSASRIASVVIEKYNLSMFIDPACDTLYKNGDIEPTFNFYRGLMIERETSVNDLTKTTEENHRDSFYSCLLRNKLLFPRLEFKHNKKIGFVDLLIEVPEYLITQNGNFFELTS
ncbi:uncharacterized protein DFL_001378 [Arthrobotrys flagrans]|uniref:AAA-ATPase-like domain-containing protein n=1 Tax=Arthrobotrys flagrans TaxID=97331 RepID=A0A437AGY0_ARTFL|nr:hypothetical protein DFL_001378 [Arthrobotrys flagrans]